MTRKIQSDKRLLIVLLLLCVTVLAQSSELFGQSVSHRSTEHCCLLCHVGPLPLLQASVSVASAPVFQVVRLEALPQIETVADFRLIPCPSRAPPAA